MRRNAWLGQASLILASQVFAAATGVLYWVAASRFYPANEVGRAAAELSLVFLLGTVAELGLRSAMVRYLAQAPSNGRQLILLFALANGTAALLLSLAMLATRVSWVADSWTNTPWLIGAVVVWTLFTVQSGALIGQRLMSSYLWQSLAFNLGKLLLLLALGALAIPNAIQASWFAIAPALTLIFAPSTLRAASPSPGRLSGTPVVIRSIIPLVSLDYVGSLLAEGSLRLLPLAVLHVLGAAEAAYFYQAFLIGSMLRLVTSSLVTSYTVEAARDPVHLNAHSRRMIFVALAMAACGAVVLAIIGPSLLLIFGPDYGREGGAALQLLGISAVPYVINAWYIAWARLRGRGLLILANEVAQFVCTFGPLSLLVPRFGLAGVALACVIGQVLPLLLALGALRDTFNWAGPSGTSAPPHDLS